MKKLLLVLMAASFLLCLTGCAGKSSNDAVERSYTQINQETAKTMMGRHDGHVVVDVRRQDEFDAGHIPGAILISN